MSTTVASPDSPEVAAPAPSTTTIAPAPRPQAQRAATASARTSRGIVTDYNYVIGELKQIAILTAVILVILVGLYFVIG